jgi:hypothetical protein
MPKSSTAPAAQSPTGHLAQTRSHCPVVLATGVLDGIDDLVSVVRAETEALTDLINQALVESPQVPIGRVRVRMEIEWEPWQNADRSQLESSREYRVIGHPETERKSQP